LATDIPKFAYRYIFRYFNNVTPISNLVTFNRPLPFSPRPQRFSNLNPFWDIWDLSDSLSSHVALGFLGPPVMLEFSEMNGQTRLPKPERTPRYPWFPAPWLRPLQRLDTLATLCGDEIFLTTPSPARFLQFPRRNWPFSVLSTVNCPNFAATVTAFSCPLTYAG